MNSRATGLLLVIALMIWSTTSAAQAGFMVTDPVGDNLGIHDITEFSSNNDGNSLIFKVTFANDITDPSLTGGDPSDLFGFIDIDTDRDAATGASSADLLSSRSVASLPGLGIEYYVDLGSVIFNGTGNADLVKTGSLDPPQVVSLVFGSLQSITVTIALADLGLGPASDVNAGVIAIDGGPPEVVSDTVSNVPVPEPASGIALTGLFLCGLASRCWGSRKNRTV